MADAKSISLKYFNIRGLAEVARIILNHAGREFIDDEVEYPGVWFAEVKATTPLGKMPLLTVDGEVYVESLPIWNFLAREFGLYPSNNQDMRTVETVVSLYYEVFHSQGKWFYLEDGPDKKAKGEEIRQNNAKYLDYIEGMLKKSATGYFVGDRVTLAEIVLFDLVTGYCHNSISFSAEKYPLIAQNNANLLKVESVKAYVDKRPAYTC